MHINCAQTPYLPPNSTVLSRFIGVNMPHVPQIPMQICQMSIEGYILTYWLTSTLHMLFFFVSSCGLYVWDLVKVLAEESSLEKCCPLAKQRHQVINLQLSKTFASFFCPFVFCSNGSPKSTHLKRIWPSFIFALCSEMVKLRNDESLTFLKDLINSSRQHSNSLSLKKHLTLA